jgi:hypothetical protein
MHARVFQSQNKKKKEKKNRKQNKNKTKPAKKILAEPRLKAFVNKQ